MIPLTVEIESLEARVHELQARLRLAEDQARQAEARARDNDARRRLFQDLVESLRDVVWVMDAATLRFTYVSPAVLGLRGYTPAEIMAAPMDAALTPDSRERVRALITERVAALLSGNLDPDTHFVEEVQQPCKDGSVVWTEVITRYYRNEATGVVEIQGITRDITERRQAEEKIRHMAQHDSLTGLPNRALFSALVERALAMAQREHHQVALAFLDLDHFKPINDIHGHLVGDLVLRETARRITETLRKSDTIGRIGGDEFILLLPNIGTPHHALEVAHKVREAVRQPILINDLSLSVSTSLGIALYPEHGLDELALAKSADQAMYFSKKIGRDCVTLYVPELHVEELTSGTAGDRQRPASRPRLQLGQIKRGLENGELSYFYQPKISLLSGRVSGAEALVRWVRPDGEIIPPGDFIPLAIESGLIKQMTLSMFPDLVADLNIIQDTCPGLVLSFNLTARDLETADIVTAARAAFARFQLDPGLLQAELTESSVINSSGKARDHILELTGMGLGLAMDDFGTGYSSIEVLSQWPFSAVKIDQGLIRGMETSEKCTTIVRASIQMAHQLGIKTVAEGVESRQVFDFLLNAGCSEVQGFWLGRPMPLSDFLAYLKQDSRWSGIPTGLIHIAQLDHIHWRRGLIDHAIAQAFGKAGRNAIRGLQVELDPRRCQLGQWYYGQGQEFHGLPSFDALEEPHFELHRLGEALLAAVEEEQPPAVITSLIRRVTDQSGIVLSILQALEYESLMARGELPRPVRQDLSPLSPLSP